MKLISKSLVGALLVLTFILNAQAVPFAINPATNQSLLQFSSQSQSQITAAINAYFDVDPTLAYKKDVGGSEEGPFASSYSTAFFNSPSDPEDATISFVSGAKITAQEIYLLVKDGNHAPYAYFFNISSWDGAASIVLNDFWVGKGAISHVSIYKRGTATPPVSNVPDGGATLVLLGLGLCGLVAARRVGLATS